MAYGALFIGCLKWCNLLFYVYTSYLCLRQMWSSETLHIHAFRHRCNGQDLLLVLGHDQMLLSGKEQVLALGLDLVLTASQNHRVVLEQILIRFRGND